MKQVSSLLLIVLLAALSLQAPGAAQSRAADACTASGHCPSTAVASTGPLSDAAFTAAGARAIVEAARQYESGTDRSPETLVSPSFTTGRWARAAARVHHASLPRTVIAAGRNSSSPRPPPTFI
jgi:hypothetical protein